MDGIRYGIFLRPDPATCWAVTQITRALQAQFGLVAAAAFAPHATLIGNLKTNATEKELVATLDSVFHGLDPIPVYNSGVERTHKGTFEYNINLVESGNSINEPLNRIAADVKAAVLPLAVPHSDY
ncbi:heme utilization protein, partial [Arthrobacter sp. 2RAF6]